MKPITRVISVGSRGGGKLGVVLARLDNQLDSPTDNGLGDITLTNF